MKEPSHRRSLEQRGVCLVCEKPFGDEEQHRTYRSYHARCYRTKIRLYARRRRGWSEEECLLPVLRGGMRTRHFSYDRCRSCQGPRFDGGPV